MKTLNFIVFVALCGVVLSAPVFSVEEGQDVSLWKRMRYKIDQLTPKKKINITTAVGGVRGDRADAGEVYWKGEGKKQAIDSDELKAFREALSLVDAGYLPMAQSAFGDFLKKFPESRLREDAEQALAQLQEKH